MGLVSGDYWKMLRMDICDGLLEQLDVSACSLDSRNIVDTSLVDSIIFALKGPK